MNCPDQVAERFRAIDAMVGNTPLLAIHFKSVNRQHTIYAKAEFLNLTGSIKDRMALHVLQSAYRRNEVKPGDTLVEATSGNTGIAFAAIGRALGHPVMIFMPDWMSPERAALIRSFGAHVEPVSKAQGGFLGSIRLCALLKCERDDVFLPCQFSNAANVDAHQLTTGPEIACQLARVNRSVTAFVAGVGTGAPLWVSGLTCGAGTQAFVCTRWSRPNPLPSPPVPKTASTASKGSRMNSCRRFAI